MDFFRLDPEVAGGLGDDAEIDHGTTPLTVRFAHYEIQTWRGSELLETFPVYVATAGLRAAVDAAGLTGVTWGEARVTVEEQGAGYMAELGITVPTDWVRLEPVGTAGVDDIGLARPGRLVVSQAALDVIGPRLGEDHERELWPPGPDSVL